MDPVTAIITTAIALLNSTDEITLLIHRLQDRQRQLVDAERDRRAASDRLTSPPVEG